MKRAYQFSISLIIVKSTNNSHCEAISIETKASTASLEGLINSKIYHKLEMQERVMDRMVWTVDPLPTRQMPW